MDNSIIDNEFSANEIQDEILPVEQVYPSVSDRVKAILTDSIVMAVFAMVAAYIFSFFENAPDTARMYTFLFIVVFYDPLFTSLFGGTIGHFMNGIRVRRERNESKKILFPLALIRFTVKLLLGWISLLTVTGNKKRKAIHDMMVGSVVVYHVNQ